MGLILVFLNYNELTVYIQYTPTKPGRYTVDVSYKGEKAPKSPYRVYHQPRTSKKTGILFNMHNTRAILRLIVNTAGVTLNYELKGVVNGKIGETIRVTIEVKEEESKRPYGMHLSMHDVYHFEILIILSFQLWMPVRLTLALADLKHLNIT